MRERRLLDWLYPLIGDEPISSVADADVYQQLREHGHAAGWSHATIDRMMAAVSGVLHYCIKRKWIDRIDKIPFYRPPKPDVRWLTREELNRLCAELPPHLACAARLAVLTLLRMRALSYLTWDRVDLERRMAWIPRAQQKAGKTFGVPLSTEAVEIFKELRRLNPEGERVFQWQGRPIDAFHSHAFKEAVDRAGLAPLRWHDLRHTGASWAVQAGVTLQELMALGDWRTYEMVMRYAHLAPTQAAKAAELVSTGGTKRAQSDRSKSVK